VANFGCPASPSGEPGVKPGEGTLLLQIIEGRFHRAFQVRGAPELLRAIPMPQRIPQGTTAMPLAGATRLLIPISVTRTKKR
jgi:hypothetical protein